MCKYSATNLCTSAQCPWFFLFFEYLLLYSIGIHTFSWSLGTSTFLRNFILNILCPTNIFLASTHDIESLSRNLCWGVHSMVEPSLNVILNISVASCVLNTFLIFPGMNWPFSLVEYPQRFSLLTNFSISIDSPLSNLTFVSPFKQIYKSVSFLLLEVHSTSLLTTDLRLILSLLSLFIFIRELISFLDRSWFCEIRYSSNLLISCCAVTMFSFKYFLNSFLNRFINSSKYFLFTTNFSFVCDEYSGAEINTAQTALIPTR